MRINGITQYDCNSRNYNKNNDRSNVKFGEVKRIVLDSVTLHKEDILESPYIQNLAKKYDIDIIIKGFLDSNTYKLTMEITAPKTGFAVELCDKIKTVWSRLTQTIPPCLYYTVDILSTEPTKNPWPHEPKKLEIASSICDNLFVIASSICDNLRRRLQQPDPFKEPEPKKRYYRSLPFPDRNK